MRTSISQIPLIFRLLAGLAVATLFSCEQTSDPAPAPLTGLVLAEVVLEPAQVQPGAPLQLEVRIPGAYQAAIEVLGLPLPGLREAGGWFANAELTAPLEPGDHLLEITGQADEATVLGYALLHVTPSASCPTGEHQEAGACVPKHTGHSLVGEGIFRAGEDPVQGAASPPLHPVASVLVEDVIISCMTSAITLVHLSDLSAITDIEAFNETDEEETEAEQEQVTIREQPLRETALSSCEYLYVDTKNDLIVLTSKGADGSTAGLATWRLPDLAPHPPAAPSPLDTRIDDEGYGPIVGADAELVTVRHPNTITILATDSNGTITPHTDHTLVDMVSINALALHENTVYAAGLHRQGKTLSGRLVQLERTGPEQITERSAVNLPEGAPRALALLPDDVLAVAAGTGGIQLFDLTPTVPTLLQRVDSLEPALGVTFTSGYLLSPTWDAVRLYDASQRGVLRQLDASDFAIGLMEGEEPALDPWFPGLHVASHISASGLQFVISELNTLLAARIEPGGSGPRLLLHDRSHTGNPSETMAFGIRVSNGGREALQVRVQESDSVQGEGPLFIPPGGGAFVEVQALAPTESGPFGGPPRRAIVLESNDPQSPLRTVALQAREGRYAVEQESPRFRVPAINTCGEPACLLETSCIDTNDLQGQVVVLAFFSSWCPLCGLEVPDLALSVREKWSEEKVQFFAANAGEPLASVASELLDNGLQTPVLVDDETLLADCWLIPENETGLFEAFHERIGDPDSDGPFPLQVVIDPQGRFAYLSRTHDPTALFAAIEKALDPANDALE